MMITTELLASGVSVSMRPESHELWRELLEPCAPDVLGEEEGEYGGWGSTAPWVSGWLRTGDRPLWVKDLEECIAQGMRGAVREYVPVESEAGPSREVEAVPTSEDRERQGSGSEGNGSGAIASLVEPTGRMSVDEPETAAAGSGGVALKRFVDLARPDSDPVESMVVDSGPVETELEREMRAAEEFERALQSEERSKLEEMLRAQERERGRIARMKGKPVKKSVRITVRPPSPSEITQTVSRFASPPAFWVPTPVTSRADVDVDDDNDEPVSQSTFLCKLGLTTILSILVPTQP